MELSILAVILGFILDLIVGDPHWLYHPIRLVGHLISGLEKILRKVFPKTERGELTAGVFLLILTAGITSGAAWILLYAAGCIHPYVKFALSVLMCYQLLATKSLKTETMKVYDALKEGDLKKARYAVSMVVGRDTDVLDEIGVTKAAVETVAENTSDGIIAPLLFMMIGGPVLGYFYKAVNTMDSMVGYKNEKYLYFGRAAAKLDDLLNWIPSRLTGFLFAVAAFLLPGMNGKEAFAIWRRDRRNHKSPNSAQSESACAGALGVQLAGDAWYFGKLNHKPAIGDAHRPVEPEDIARANRLMYLASVLALFAGTGLIILLEILTGGLV